MSKSRPNIVLFMTDQHRGDCLGIDGHPIVQTPRLDELGNEGCYFKHAYAACPLCMPARRSLLSGTRPCTHGLVGNVKGVPLQFETLPEALRQGGYQTHLVGKQHLWPLRKRYGFESMDWSDGPYGETAIGDYGTFLSREVKKSGIASDKASAHGTPLNSWLARPWHLDERLHFTNWVTDQSLEFLDRRDPTVPFFLMVSYFHPHQPVTPPEFYYNRYLQMDLPEPVVGDWVGDKPEPEKGMSVQSPRVALDPVMAKQYRAGYYGCINHIDDQIGRILECIPFDSELGRNTLFLFVSDHGELLGDHYGIKKSLPLEPSARIPFLMKFPDSHRELNRQDPDEVVELMDVMPTVLDLAGVAIPDTVEGNSLLPLLRGDKSSWRSYLHGECAQHGREGFPDFVHHYLTDGKRKYIWFSTTDRELMFDLEKDPQELKDLSQDPVYKHEVNKWRKRLVDELKNRPEGFTDGKRLTPLDEPPPLQVPRIKKG